MQHDATCFVALCVSMQSVVAYMPRGGVYASCPRTGLWYSNKCAPAPHRTPTRVRRRSALDASARSRSALPPRRRYELACPQCTHSTKRTLSHPRSTTLCRGACGERPRIEINTPALRRVHLQLPHTYHIRLGIGTHLVSRYPTAFHRIGTRPCTLHDTFPALRSATGHQPPQHPGTRRTHTLQTYTCVSDALLLRREEWACTAAPHSRTTTTSRHRRQQRNDCPALRGSLISSRLDPTLPQPLLPISHPLPTFPSRHHRPRSATHHLSTSSLRSPSLCSQTKRTRK
ncbi:hypothetical protein B0H14DRAFT_3487169 [Mycena olivaceomarginata]|nr:hypothetical protein B0H14DRAFT_3487169 [Mycena olivaceomarginata]